MNKEVNVISLNQKAWNNVAEKYNESNYNSQNPLVEYFCEFLPLHGSVLDLGSGTGIPFAKLFVERGFNYLGIDISSQMVKIAQENVPSANFIEMSMTDINFQNRFDGVFSSYSMLLLNSVLLKDAAKKIDKALKNDGLLYISLNEAPEEEMDLDRNVLVKIMGELMYSRAYTEEEINNIFSPLGLKKIKTHREILSSEEFGIEHMMVMIFKKTRS